MNQPNIIPNLPNIGHTTLETMVRSTLGLLITVPEHDPRTVAHGHWPTGNFHGPQLAYSGTVIENLQQE